MGRCNKKLVKLVGAIHITRRNPSGPCDSSYLKELIKKNLAEFSCENPSLTVLQHAPVSQDNHSDLEITSGWIWSLEESELWAEQGS